MRIAGSGIDRQAARRDHGTVFAAGDNAYMSAAQQYRDCYDPGWGRHKGRTRPAPGNHEYETPGAAPYFDISANAGPPGQGYYSFPLGNWHVISLNSNIDVGEGSAQGRWLASTWPRIRRNAPSRIGTIRCSARDPTETTRRCARSGASCTPPASTSSWSGTITCTSASRRKTRTAVSIPPAASGSSSPAPAAQICTLRHGSREQRKAHQRVRRPQAHAGGRSLRLGVHPGRWRTRSRKRHVSLDASLRRCRTRLTF